MRFNEFLTANGLDDPYRIYDYFFNQIQDAASAVGIDLAISDLDLSRDNKTNRLRVSDKSAKGKVVAYVTLQDKQGVKLPYFRFYTNKGGGVDESFSCYNALWALYKAAKPIDKTAKPPAEKRAIKSVVPNDLQNALWKEQQVAKWGNEHLNGSLACEESLYLQAKFGEFVHDAAKASALAGIKRGQDKYGDYLIVRMENKAGRVVGYQKIYDELVQFRADEEPRNKDYRFLTDGKKGAFVKIGVAEKLDDYVFIVEGLATGLSVYLATGKAVFVAGDASNLAAVLDAVQSLGFKRPIIAADNDVSDKGNTGIYAALKAAKTHSARIFVANLDNQKADFNDVLIARGMGALKKQLIFRSNAVEIIPERNAFEGALQLLALCQKNQLKKHVWIACSTAVSNQFLVDLDDAAARIAETLAQRGEDVWAVREDVDRVIKKALFYAVKRCKAKNTASFNGFNAIVDCTTRDNDSIAAEILNNKGIWLDSRPMGTGKTELMGSVLALATLRNLSSSYICHRQSLVANSSERIKAISYKKINSGKDLMYENAIALCINSIINPRFCSYVTQYSNVIFIDEIRQTLEHVAIGSINASERKSVFDALILAIKTADYVLGSDADLNQVTVDWLKHNFPEKAFFGLTCEPRTPKAEIAYSSYEAAFNAAIKSALAGTATLIQCDSIKASKTVFEAVNRPHLKVLLVNSENKADADQARFLLNPDEEIKNYDTVIHSPVIGSGVSITCDHIKAHYALFRGVLAENEVLQMIGRNRNSDVIVVGFNDKHVKNRVNSAKTLLDGEVIGRARIVDGEPIIDALDRLRIKVISRHNDSLNDVAVQSLLLMRMKGYRLKRFEGDESIEQLAVARECARTVHCKGVLGADVISALDAYKLEKAESITQEESYKLERYNIEYGFALPSTQPMTTDDVVFFDSGRVLKVINNREIANASKEQRTAVDEKNGGFKSVAKGFHIDVLLMCLADKTVDQYHAKAVLDYLQKNHAEIAACGLGNFSKVSKYPIRAVNQFLEHFGYQLIGRKISQGARKGDRVYKLKSDERIDEIVARRTVQNPYKSVADAA